MKNKVINNIFFSSLTGIISKVGAFIFTVIIARNFYPEQFGLYSLTLTIIISILVLSDLGLGSTMTRYLSESIGNKNKKQTRSRFLFIMKYKFFLSIIISLLLLLCSGFIAAFFNKPELILPLQIGSVYLFFHAIYNIAISVFLPLQKLKYYAISETIFQVSRIILLLTSFYFFKSITSVFIILSLTLILSLIYSTSIVSTKFPFLIKGDKEPVERRRLLKFSGVLALSSFTILIFSNIDKLILGYYLDLQFVGFYTAILTIIGGVLGLIGIASALTPTFTQLNNERLEKVFKKAFHYISLITFPIAIGLAFIIIPLLKILYGYGYVPLQYEFSILITSILLCLIIIEFTFSSLYKILLNSKEMPKIPALTSFLTAILNVLLNILLISYFIKINPIYGLIGASVATFISRYIGMFIIIHMSKKNLNIINDKDSIIKPLFSSLVMLGYLFIFDYFVQLTIVSGVIMILTAAIVYLITIFIIKAISIEEIKDLFNR